MVMAAGSEGVKIRSKDVLNSYGRRCKVVADVNTAPPLGAESLDSLGDELRC